MAHTKPVLRALLVTDLVDSTWLVEQLGDLRAAELFARHDRLARDLLLAWKGLEIDRTDGFLFLFDRALDAVRYALHYQRSLSELAREVGSPLQARVGIHVGEVLLRENSVEDVARGAKPLEVEGLAKPICARLAALARGGQVLLSRTAYDLAHRSALDDTLEGRVSWMEHGTYMLKGVADPVEVVEVGEAGLAPLIAPQASDKARAMRALTNLPQAQTSFVGRSADLAALRSLLPSHRLLTLTGSGGCGKTRLAHHFGAELLRGDGDGVWLVDLAGQQEPSLVVAAVAAVFRVVEAPGRPLLQSLLEHLRDRYLLLILDNCEHLLDAVARLAEAILRQCPQVWLLVTSREALGIAGEQTWRVQPLPVPDPRHLQLAALAEVDSVRLFVERAALVRPGFALNAEIAPAVARICQRLDGIPLAIELAAARVRAMGVDSIAARLSDRFRLLTGGSRTALPRQQTLRALIDWSYDLLPEAEKLLLCRLSVFSGGWTLEAAEAICAGGVVEDWAVLDGLTSLVDKSLVLVDEGEGGLRYRMLETVRHYGQDRLTERGEWSQIRDRCADHYGHLMAEARLEGPEERLWLDRLEAELGNLRAALEWCAADPSRAEQALEMAVCLGKVWRIRGHLTEGKEKLAEVLAATASLGPSASRARVANGLAIIHSMLGDHAAASAGMQEVLAMRRALGDLAGEARALFNFGDILTAQGELQAAREALLAGQALARQHGLPQLGFAGNLGNVCAYLGQLDEAEGLLQEELALDRAAGRRDWEAEMLTMLGKVAAARGERGSARSHYRQGLLLAEELDFKALMLQTIQGLAALCWQDGQGERAARLYAAHASLQAGLGARQRAADRPEHERNVEDLRSSLGEAIYAACRAEGEAWDWQQAVNAALIGDGGP